MPLRHLRHVPPQTVWQFWLIVYRTKLTLSLSATLKENTKKIVLVTLCILIKWLFYHVFWCETVPRKRRRLHKAQGHVLPLLQITGHGGHPAPRVEEPKKEIGQTVSSRKRSPKRLIVLVKPKKWRGTTKKIAACHFLNSSQRHWIDCHLHRQHHHRLVHKTV